VVGRRAKKSICSTNSTTFATSFIKTKLGIPEAFATTEKSSPFLVGISFFVSSTWAYANKDINYAASAELTPKRDQTTSYFLHQFLPAMIILELIGILLPFNRICQ